MNTFKTKYGEWALITGGAQGMGAAFARAIGAQGINLLLLDREAELLETTRQQIQQELGVEVQSIHCDLADTNFITKVDAACTGKEVGLVAASAAVGHVGPFEQTPLDAMLNSIRINVDAPLILSRHFVPMMIERGRGGLILFSSNSAYHGTPYVSNYAATKAYNLVLGEGLWYELKDKGVDVLSIVPGATNTSGFRSANPKLKEGQKVKGVLLPEETASAALKQLGKRPSTRPSFKDELETVFMSRILNRKSAIKLLGDKINQRLTRNVG